jgi:hypothetical protein
MDKTAKELIEKLAMGKKSPLLAADVAKLKTMRQNVSASAQKAKAGYAARKAEDDAALAKMRGLVKDTEKKSSMKNIIDDIIKGAEQNTFGRPVNVQVSSEFTPLDVAKFAGALQYLAEQDYSVKQAAEYLGLTDAQVLAIVDTVR